MGVKSKDIPVIVAISKVPNQEIYLESQYCGVCGTSLQKIRNIGDCCYKCGCNFTRIMYVWYGTNMILTSNEIRMVKLKKIFQS